MPISKEMFDRVAAEPEMAEKFAETRQLTGGQTPEKHFNALVRATVILLFEGPQSVQLLHALWAQAHQHTAEESDHILACMREVGLVHVDEARMVHLLED